MEKYSASKCILCGNSLYIEVEITKLLIEIVLRNQYQKGKNNAHECKQDRLDVLPRMDRGLTSFQVTTRHADQNCGIERLYQNQAIKELAKRRISEELQVVVKYYYLLLGSFADTKA